MRILVIEDNPYDAFDIATKIRLVSGLAIVDVAETADEGLHKVKGCDATFYDFVFVDQHMPGDTGTMFCRRYRDRIETKRSKLILVTSDGSDQTRAEALASNFDGFLRKPADPVRLRQFLDGTRCHWDISDLPRNLELYRAHLRN